MIDNIERLKKLAGIPLYEANIVNATRPILFNVKGICRDDDEYVTDGVIIIPSLKQQIDGLADLLHANTQTKKWMQTILYNFYVRNEPATLNQIINYGFIEYFNYDYIKDYLSNIDLIVEPTEKIINDIWDSMPDYIKRNPGYIIGDATFIDKNGRIDFMGQDKGVLQEIIDFLNSQPNISTMSVPDARRLSDEWHKIKTKKNAPSIVEEKDYKTIYKFADGFSIVRLLTPNSFKYEAHYMAHCIGKGGFDVRLNDSNFKYLSLWNSDNIPYATMELKGKEITQLQGFKNGIIAQEVHIHLLKFFAMAGLSVTSHHRNIDLQGITI